MSDEERARHARLPDLRAVALNEDEWERRTRDASLYRVFDVEGRPAGPTDDDRYDAVEATMRAEGRIEEAERFAAKRPPRKPAGDPPRECFVDDPDPYRRGPESIEFELRVRKEADGRLSGWSIRALITPGRTSDGLWAHLSRVEDALRVSGRWSDVPEETFERLLRATAQVFGDVPRHQPDASAAPAVQVEVRSCRGGQCGRCDTPIADLGLRVRFGGAGDYRFHLSCAKREYVESAIAFHGLGEDDLGEALALEQGPLRRCRACKGIIRKDDWRLSPLYGGDALHLECAVEHAREGFRLALWHDRNSGLPDADVWRAKLE